MADSINGLTQLRGTLESVGHKVGWNPNNNQVLVNDKPLDVAGYQNIGGHYYGTPEQVSKTLQALGTPTLRGTVESTGNTVGWDQAKGQVSINNQPYDTTGWTNVGGTYYGNKDMQSKLLQQYPNKTAPKPTQVGGNNGQTYNYAPQQFTQPQVQENEQQTIARLTKDPTVAMVINGFNKNKGDLHFQNTTQANIDAYYNQKINNDLSYYLPSLSPQERTALTNYMKAGNFSNIGQTTVNQQGQASFGTPEQEQQKAEQARQEAFANTRDVNQAQQAYNQAKGYIEQNGQLTPNLQTQSQQQNQQGQQLTARGELEKDPNIMVDWDPNNPNMMIVNGKYIDPARYGLQNINGRFTGTPEQIKNFSNAMAQLTADPTKQATDTYIQGVNDLQKSYTNAMTDVLKDRKALSQNIIDTLKSTNYTSTMLPVMQKIIKDVDSSTFTYDPLTDPEFQQASKALERQVMEEMNSRGILNSTVTLDRITKTVQEMIPEFRKQAYMMWQDKINQKWKSFDAYGKIDEMSYRQYKDNLDKTMKIADYAYNFTKDDMNIIKDNFTMATDLITKKYSAQIKLAENDIQKRKDAMDRVKLTGYANNYDASILGVAPGTLSEEVAKENRQTESELKKIMAKGIEDRKNTIEESKKSLATIEANKQADIDKKKAEELAKSTQKGNMAQILAPISSLSADEKMQYLNNSSGALKQLIKEEKINGADLQDAILEIGKQKQQEIDNYYKADASSRGWTSINKSDESKNIQTYKDEYSRVDSMLDSMQKDSIGKVYSKTDSEKLYDANLRNRPIDDFHTVGSVEFNLALDKINNSNLSVQDKILLATKYGLNK